mmetsp:Transcript_16006/g.37079  ORF Transcript_16006/g.37079 Transcript_16006/m.37079 type:complete len:390 (-) Transcript_16006:588-1757(-)
MRQFQHLVREPDAETGSIRIGARAGHLSDDSDHAGLSQRRLGMARAGHHRLLSLRQDGGRVRFLIAVCRGAVDPCSSRGEDDTAASENRKQVVDVDDRGLVLFRILPVQHPLLFGQCGVECDGTGCLHRWTKARATGRHVDGPNLSLRALPTACGPPNVPIISPQPQEFQKIAEGWIGDAGIRSCDGYRACIGTTIETLVGSGAITEKVEQAHSAGVLAYPKGGNQRGFCHLSILRLRRRDNDGGLEPSTGVGRRREGTLPKNFPVQGPGPGGQEIEGGLLSAAIRVRDEVRPGRRIRRIFDQHRRGRVPPPALGRPERRPPPHGSRARAVVRLLGVHLPRVYRALQGLVQAPMRLLAGDGGERNVVGGKQFRRLPTKLVSLEGIPSTH